MDIVNDKYINTLIEVDKIIDRVKTTCIGKLNLEQMRREIQHFLVGIELLHFGSDGMTEMCFPHARMTMNKERVEGCLGRVVGYCLGSRTCQTIAITFKKIVKGMKQCEFPTAGLISLIDAHTDTACDMWKG